MEQLCLAACRTANARVCIFNDDTWGKSTALTVLRLDTSPLCPEVEIWKWFKPRNIFKNNINVRCWDVHIEVDEAYESCRCTDCPVRVRQKWQGANYDIRHLKWSCICVSLGHTSFIMDLTLGRSNLRLRRWGQWPIETLRLFLKG